MSVDGVKADAFADVLLAHGVHGVPLRDFGQVMRSVLVAVVLASVSVPYQVRTERATPRVLAAIRANTTPQRLSSDIIGLLDQVWPVLREQGVRTGHNVVVYRPGEAGVLTIDAGVEVFSEFAGRGTVRRMATPAGEVAATAHYGEYSAMAGAYKALEQWCTANSRQPAAVNWEVYGDWDDDPGNRRTDVYVLLSPDRRP